MQRDPEAIDRRLFELNALSRLASVGVESDETGVIDEVLQVVWQLVPCRQPLLFLVDSEGEHFALYTRGQRQASMPMSERSIVRRIYESGSGEVINTVTSDPDLSSMLAEDLKVKQVVASPLCIGGDCLGVLGAADSLRGAFCDEDLTVMSALGSQAATALQSARLRMTVRRQLREIEGVHRLSQLLTTDSTPDHLIAESVRMVADLADCEKVAVLLYEDDADELVALPQAVGIGKRQTSRIRVSLSAPSLSASVFRTNAPLISNDAANDAWVGKELRALLDIESILVVPVGGGSRPTGVLKLMNARKGYFDESDLRFCSIMGSRLGGVIESSHARQREHALVQRLREADQTKSEFVSMLAHELKGPITTVMGFGQVLQQQWRDLDDPKRDRILEVVTKEVGRLARLVNDLLDLSRMEAGTLRYDIAPVSLFDLVESIVSVHGSITAKHELELDLADDLPKVQGDADRIRQVLLNLLTNATRYSPDGTPVTLTARVMEDGNVRVSVKDEGIGISREDQKRLFSKFVTLPKPAWLPKGTGLGLYITEGIVEAHGASCGSSRRSARARLSTSRFLWRRTKPLKHSEPAATPSHRVRR